jgi:biotin transporter BioY
MELQGPLAGIWVIAALATAWLADERGRPFLVWLMVALVIGPIATLIVGFAPLGTAVRYKACVECQLAVPLTATRCPFCRTDLIRAEAEEASTTGVP